jgi:hypothetical protein
MLSFRSQKTAAIEYDSTEGEIKDALELLSTIGAVEVTFATGNTEACIGAGNAIAVNFTSELGNVPALVSSDLSSLGGGTGTVVVSETIAGTKENVECSEKGACDRLTGRCKCFEHYSSSDGFGNMGTRGDCGFYNEAAAGDCTLKKCLPAPAEE